MRIAVEIDPAAALHVEHGLELHRAWCERHRHLIPSGFDELARQMAIAKTAPPDRKEPATDTSPGSIEPVDEFLTQRVFAARVGRSERTIRNWLAAGKLATTVAGIPATELSRLTRGVTNVR